jgi:putative phage-type endonuclease
MNMHDFVQGSDAWHQHRATHFNASDAPAMMGCSPYQTRTELLTRMKTGISAEVDADTQRRFDDGHRFEALARPLAEKIIGDELYPVTGSRGELSASFDGLTLDGLTAFEHKTLNLSMAGLVWVSESAADFLPLHYLVQMEQQMMVSGAERVLFMASIWNGDELVEARHCWYRSDPELRAKIVAGWHQFAKDLVEFVPSTVEAPKPTGKAPEALPALHIVIQGGVSASNLDEFKETALGAIRSVNRELTTDVHFADAEKAVKWCSDIEDRIKAAKDHALSQTASIDALFKTMDEISAEARRVRLDLDKLVKARKDALKADIVAEGISAFAKHIRELNAAMPADYMPTVPADFGGCIKGLRTLESVRNAVSTELANAKIKASEIANLIHKNIGQLDAANAPQLFAFDITGLVLKNSEDLANVIALRLDQDAKRKEAETARIRSEEAARLEREAEADRARAAKVEVDRIAREQAEAVSAARIREEQAEAAERMNKVLSGALLKQSAAQEEAFDAAIKTGTGAFKVMGFDMASQPDIGTPADDGARLTLGQINERLAPVAITVAGMEQLGYKPVTVEKAARLYRASDFPAICKAISAHVLAAPVKAMEEA